MVIVCGRKEFAETAALVGIKRQLDKLNVTFIGQLSLDLFGPKLFSRIPSQV